MTHPKTLRVLITSLIGLFLFLSSSCSGGSSSVLAGAQEINGKVSGRVVDTSGAPITGASVKACNDLGESVDQVVTGSSGLFELRVPDGLVDVAVLLSGNPVYQVAVFVQFQEEVQLGDIMVDASLADTDGDGLPDALENEGWMITLDLDGYDQLTTKLVHSSPFSADSDGDGLSDAAEFGARIDPTRADTDGDQLSDLDEMTMYKSNPADVDTDGDARGPEGTAQPNPSLFDGQELLLSGTSPTLADTDGDGLTDYQEILGGGFNPRIADLPQLSLELNGDPSLTLNAEKTETSESVSASSTLQRDQNETTQTDSVSTKVAVEASQKIKQEVESAFPPAASVKTTGELEFKESFSQETSSSWSETSVHETQQTYSNSFETGEQLTFTDGEIQQALKFTNQSERTFLMKDMKVIAFRLDPLSPGSFQVVGTMSPSAGDLPEDGLILAPGGEATFIAQNESINWQAMQPLMKNPTSLFFEIGSYSLFETDDSGAATKNFAVTGQDVIERCGLIVIDYGDGRIERYTVATNVERNPDGSAKGVTLAKALGEIIGVPFGTEPELETGKLLLTSLGDVSAFVDEQNEDILGFWTVAGGGADFGPDATADFGDVVLQNGTRISLMYLQDTDGDGLYDREEEAWGTSKIAVDTDQDGLGDYVEVHEGWDVLFTNSEGSVLPQFTYHVFPDPKLSDTDLDGLTDFDESLLGTDPREADTDGDGLFDSVDASPLDAPGDTGSPGLGLVAYYQLAQSFEDASGEQNHGVATSYTSIPWMLNGGNGYFDFVDRFGLAGKAMYVQNPEGSGGSGDVTVHAIETPLLDLSTSYSYSIWVKPTESFQSGGQPDYVMGHEPSEGLKLEISTDSYEPRYDVPLVGGGSHTLHAGLNIPEDAWSNVVVVVSTDPGGSSISMYVNGVLGNSEATASGVLPLGLAPVFIGASDASQFGDDYFSGGVDDVRIYQKAVDGSTVSNIYGEGGFGN